MAHLTKNQLFQIKIDTNAENSIVDISSVISNESAEEDGKNVGIGIKTVGIKIGEIVPADKIERPPLKENKIKAQENPFLIEMVMDNIIAFLDKYVMLNCREVCQVWAKKFSKDLSKVVFVDCGGMNPKKLQSFLKSNENNKFSIFQQFRFAWEDPILSRSFVRIFGHNLSKLILEISYNSSITLPEFSKLFVKDCPNLTYIQLGKLPPWLTNVRSFIPKPIILQKLNTIQLYGIPNNAGCYSQHFLHELFAATPNLISFKTTWAPYRLIEKVLKAWSENGLNGLQIIRNLTELDLSGSTQLTDRTLNTLSSVKFKSLKKLNLSDIHAEFTKIPFENFLASVSGSLEYFHCPKLDLDPQRAFNIDLPLMPKLKILKIPDWSKLGPFSNFLEKLPNLRKLNFVSYISFLRIISLFNTEQPSVGLSSNEFKEHFLRELILPHDYNNKDDIKGILKGLKSLKKITLWVNDEILKIIYENATQLEALQTHSLSSITDSGITGLDLKFCQELLSQGELYLEEEGIHRNSSFIGNLIYLKSLRFEDHAGRRMTDISVFYGLIHLKNLQSLVLLDSQNLSCLGVEELCLELPLVHLELIKSNLKAEAISEMKRFNPRAFIHISR